MTRRIMVVDDDPDHLAVVSSILEEGGYRIERAYDAEQALSRVHEFDPALILTDLRMPGMDGVELLERVKAGMGTVEVIVMTGHEDMTSAIGAMKAGAFDYVVKPIEAEALLNLVSRCLRERKLNLAVRERGVPEDAPEERHPGGYRPGPPSHGDLQDDRGSGAEPCDRAGAGGDRNRKGGHGPGHP